MKRNIMRMLCIFIVCVCIIISFSFKILGKENKGEASLFGKVIYIDAGHGGKDNGASFDGVLEDEINLKIAGYIIGNLLDLGAYTLTSRTSDYDLAGLYDKNKKRQDLINRVKQINESQIDVFLSIHLNSYSSQEISGAQVFYQKNDGSELLANKIQNNLNILSSKKGRKTKLGDYYILNNTEPIGVLIECGFLSNDEERNKLTTESYQQKIAKNITTGVVEYFNNLVN